MKQEPQTIFVQIHSGECIQMDRDTMDTLVTFILTNDLVGLEAFIKDHSNEIPDWSTMRCKEIDMMYRMAQWPVIRRMIQQGWLPIHEVMSFASYYEWNEDLLEGLEKDQPEEYVTIAKAVNEYRQSMNDPVEQPW